MRLEGARQSAFKIGWAFDYEKRARQFNRAALPNLGGIEYKVFLCHRWDTAKMAYHMEQNILKYLSQKRLSENNEIVTEIKEEEIKKLWCDLISETTELVNLLTNDSL